MKWATIRRHPAYEINEEGDIRRKKTGKILKPYSVDGHLKVKLSGSTEYVSRLVAESYLKKKGLANEVQHKNYDKSDNRVSNLAWANHKEIQESYFESGLHPKGGAMPPKTIKVIETGEVYYSIRSCAKAFGVNAISIRKCLKDRDKMVCGYHFELI